MSIINPDSLSATLDNLNDAFLQSRRLPQAEKLEIARWLASLQGKPGSYCGMPAPRGSGPFSASLPNVTSAAVSVSVPGLPSCPPGAMTPQFSRFSDFIFSEPVLLT